MNFLLLTLVLNLISVLRWCNMSAKCEDRYILRDIHTDAEMFLFAVGRLHTLFHLLLFDSMSRHHEI